MANFLIIEDDPHFAELLRVLLTHKGHEVTCAPDLAAAKACLGSERAGRFDLILMDFLLNGATAGKLIELARGRAAGARLVMMSADTAAMRESMKSFFDSKMIDAVIPKPCDFDTLLSLIEELIAR